MVTPSSFTFQWETIGTWLIFAARVDSTGADRFCAPPPALELELLEDKKFGVNFESEALEKILVIFESFGETNETGCSRLAGGDGCRDPPTARGT